MTDLNFEEQQTEKVIRSMYKDDLNFVVTHGFENLPQSVFNKNLNILVDDGDFLNAIEICEDLHFEKTSKDVSLLREYLEEPFSHIVSFTKKPVPMARKALRLYRNDNLVKGQSDSRRVTTVVFSRNDLNIIIHNHLGYTPYLWQDEKLRIHPDVEKGMLETKKLKKGLFYIPTPPYFLIHLLCEGIFDYKGTFPDYHTQRCNGLWDEVSANEDMENNFYELLSTIFFGADDLVLKCVEQNNFNSIRDKLMTFSDY